MTKRNLLLALGTILVILGLYFSDPNGGAITLAFMQQFTLPIMAVWFAYISRKILMDYVDMEELLNKAKESAVGAGITFLGVCLVFAALLGLFGTNAHAQNVSTYIPERAQVYLPVVKQEQVRLWAEHPKPTSLVV